MAADSDHVVSDADAGDPTGVPEYAPSTVYEAQGCQGHKDNRHARR